MKRDYKQSGSFNDTNPNAGGKRDIVKITDHLDIFKFKGSKYVTTRLVGPVFKMALHWIEVFTKEGKKIRFPKKCFRYDAESDAFDSTVECPYCDKLHDEYKAKQRYYTNAIIRDLEEDAPSKFQKKYSKSEAKTGFKDGMDSKAWTPVRVLDIPAGVAGKIKGLADLNKHTVKRKKKAMPLSDEKYGKDLEIKYDEKAKSPSQAYDVQKGDSSELDETQQNYLHWDIGGAIAKVQESLEEDIKKAREEVKRLKVVKKADGASDDYEDSGESKGKKKKGKGKKEKSEEESSETSSEESSEKSEKSEESSEGSAEESSEKSEKSEESSEGSEESSEKSDKKPAKKGDKKGKGKKKEESSEEGSDEKSEEESSEESSEGSEESSDFNLDEKSGEESSDAKGKGKGKKGDKKGKGKKKEESSEESSEGSDAENSEESSEEASEKSDKKSSKKSGKDKKKSGKKKEESDESSF